MTTKLRSAAPAPTAPLFGLGRVVITPGACAALSEAYGRSAEMETGIFLRRHAACDFGDLDDSDRRANNRAYIDGGRILSAYQIPAAAGAETEAEESRIWIVTEAEGDDGQRESTTVLLPSEY